MAQGEIALAEIGAPEAVFGFALGEGEFLFDHGAALLVRGDLVKLAEFVSGFDAADQFEHAPLQKFLVEAVVRNRCAVVDGDKIRSGEFGLGGGAERERFETALVVAAKFHGTNRNAVSLEEELLGLLVGVAVEPIIHLGDLVAVEVGEFGWKGLFSHKFFKWLVAVGWS